MGKTTLSLAAAIHGARQGKRVAAITVDPSRRLTSLLGLDSSSDQRKTVQWGEEQHSFDIFYVEPQKVFTDFVSKNMKADHFEKLSGNGIYKQISKNLRETHNFAALYKMHEVLKSPDYDLVILDTPPCHQVIDFFESPRRLQRFFSAKPVTEKKSWLRWVQETGVTVVESFLKTMVGNEFVEEMDAFFNVVGELRSEINNVSSHFIEVLAEPTSQLMLVFPPAQDKLQDALYMDSELEKNHFNVDGYVLNRAYP